MARSMLLASRCSWAKSSRRSASAFTMPRSEASATAISRSISKAVARPVSCTPRMRDARSDSSSRDTPAEASSAAGTRIAAAIRIR